MPAVPFVVAIAVDYAVEALIVEFVSAAFAGTVLASSAGVITGVISGAAGGAASAAVSGGDIGKGALLGGVGSAVSSSLSPYTKEFVGNVFPDFSPAAKSAVTRGLTSTVSGTATGLAGGQSIGDALKGGAARGLTSGVSQYAFSSPDSPEGPSKTDYGGRIGQAALNYGLGTVLNPSPQGAPSSTSPTAPQATSPTTTTAGTSGSAVLGAALGVDPGIPTFGGSKDSPQSSAWNVSSLKYKDETGD